MPKPRPEARPIACAHTTVLLSPEQTPGILTWHSLPFAESVIFDTIKTPLDLQKTLPQYLTQKLQ